MEHDAVSASESPIDRSDGRRDLGPEAISRSSGCCGSSPRDTVADYIDRGLQRRRRAPLPIRGDPAGGDGGLSACFSLRVERGEIAEISFECSTCMTLVAYCELLCETVERGTLRAAVRVASADLAAQLQGVPPLRRDRATLAVSAFHRAIRHALAQEG